MFELNEIQEFLIFMIEGAMIGFIFDFFRGFRKSFKADYFATLFEDIIFLLITSIIFFSSIIYILGR